MWVFFTDVGTFHLCRCSVDTDLIHPDKQHDTEYARFSCTDCQIQF